MSQRSAAGVLVALSLLLAARIEGQTPTVFEGDQFQVNFVTEGAQIDASVAVAEDGDFVVVWKTRHGALDPQSIEALRFGPDGTPVGQQMRVDTYMTSVSHHGASQVAMLPGGEFVVTWASSVSPGSDQNGSSIQARRFGSDGQPVETQFQVNAYTSGDQVDSFASAGAGDDFLIVWTSEGSGGGDNSETSVQGRMVPSEGGALSPQFQVNTYETSLQHSSSALLLDENRFLVTWATNEAPDEQEPEHSLRGRIFDAAGAPVGNDFVLNTSPVFRPDLSAVPDPSGGFSVVWTSSPLPPAEFRWLYRRFDSSGLPVSDELSLPVESADAWDRKRTEFDSDGDFVVMYMAGYDVMGKRFLSDGSPIGQEFQMNRVLTNAFQFQPALAVAPHGDFIGVWESTQSAGNDSYSIQGQRFRVTADIGDRVWLDEDGDGIQDPGEPGVPDVLIRLKDGSGELLASTRTDENGHFLFRPKIALEGVTDQFYLKFVAPHAMAFTRQDVGLGSFEDADSDADPLSGNTAVFTIESAGEIHFDIDAGLVDDSGIFSDGFESGDVSAWSSAAGILE